MSFLDRLNDEAVELSVRLNKLCEFLCSDKFNELSKANQLLLSKQKKAMEEYLSILDIRLALLRGA
jgi:hypothetical protein